MIKLTEQQVAAAVTMYEQGSSVAQVAQTFGLTRSAMYQRLTSRRVQMRPQKRFGMDNHFYRGTADNDHAQNIVEKAVASGRLVRPKVCDTCGQDKPFKDGRAGIQAHHPDYNEPLTLMWLCQPCHHQWHRHNQAIPLNAIHGKPQP
jgi:transposase-like protein